VTALLALQLTLVMLHDSGEIAAFYARQYAATRQPSIAKDGRLV